MTDDPADRIDLRSVFLGPKAENADVFEKLLLEAFRDHVFWRRNFHPEDGFRTMETEKRSASYEHSISVLSQELLSLLAELKAGVPFFSPRYIGHMTSDLTMASLIGYFATMLYNPNNVAAEASPVTTRLELEVADQLAAMVGYPAEAGWGHLTSGGTVANYEALWVARNVKYLPVAVRWAAEELGVELDATLPSGSKAPLTELDLWALLNLRSGDALDLADAFRDQLDPETAVSALHRHTLADLGYQAFGQRLKERFGDALPSAVVLVPSTAHYSFEKICRSLGIGGAQLVHVPVDTRFRMDPDALEATLDRLAAERRPIVACVCVAGTTEESAVDQIDRAVAIRERAAAEHELSFHLHADGAWGGYAVSITRNPDGSRRSYQDTLADNLPEQWPSEAVYRSLCAIEATDSVTIDPHKLGFTPYPAGAICFRDRRARDLVAVEAPYVFHKGASEWGYIGRYIFEGSKPGAAAAAVWMSHKVLPLDCRGHGRLVGASSRGALLVHRRLAGGEWDPFKVALLPAPDLNIVCFGLSHESFDRLEQANELVDRVYRSLSAGERTDARQLEFFVTKTELRAPEYGDAAIPTVEALGFEADEYRRIGGVQVIRCTVMDPFLAIKRDRVDYVEGFSYVLRQVMAEALEAMEAERP